MEIKELIEFLELIEYEDTWNTDTIKEIIQNLREYNELREAVSKFADVFDEFYLRYK